MDPWAKPGEVAKGGGGSRALYDALRSTGVEPVPLQDMILKDACVRDFDIATGSVETLLESLEANLVQETEEPIETKISFELQRVAAITEKLEIECAENVKKFDELARRKEELLRKTRESADRCEEKFTLQLKKAAVLEVFAARYKAGKDAEAEAKRAAEAPEAPAQESATENGGAKADDWQDSNWQQSSWQKDGDWQKDAWATADEKWDTPAPAGTGTPPVQVADPAAVDGGLGIYDASQLNAGAHEFVPATAAEASGAGAPPGLEGELEEDAENPWHGIQ